MAFLLVGGDYGGQRRSGDCAAGREKMMPTMLVIVQDGSNLDMGDDCQIDRIPNIGDYLVATLGGLELLSKVMAIACRCQNEYYIVITQRIADVTGEDPSEIARKVLGEQQHPHAHSTPGRLRS
jgi:hypothetical protein